MHYSANDLVLTAKHTQSSRPIFRRFPEIAACEFEKNQFKRHQAPKGFHPPADERVPEMRKRLSARKKIDRQSVRPQASRHCNPQGGSFNRAEQLKKRCFNAFNNGPRNKSALAINDPHWSNVFGSIAFTSPFEFLLAEVQAE